MKETFEIVNGELVKYNGSDTEILIPEVVEINEAAFYSNNTIRSIVLSEGTETIKSWAFGYCTSLRMIFIPASIKQISPSSFDGCVSLEKIVVSKDNKYYSSIDGILFDKAQQKLILFPRGSKIQNYTIPGSVESIGDNAFNRCFNLKKINISESVVSVGYKAFGYCTALKSVFIPKGIKEIGYCAFASTTSIEEFIVDGDNEEFRSIYGVLFNSSGRKLIQFPSGRRTDSFFISDHIESICERALSDSHLSSIIVDHNNPFFRDVNGCLFSCDLSLLICYPTQRKEPFFSLPGGVSKICNSAFKNNKHLESVKFPNTLEFIDRHAFEDCERLKTISSDKCSLKELGWACFSGCISLESICFPLSKQTVIQGHAFYNCKKLDPINPSKVKSIGFEAFDSF